MSQIVNTLVLTSFLSVFSFSQMAPFYPLLAIEKGITVFYVGLVLGSNAVTYMLACYFGGENLHRIGRECAIMFGMLFVMVQQFGLYTLKSFNDPNEFLIMSFVAQLIGGFGSGLNAVSSMAIIVTCSKASEKEQNIGLIEMAAGVGYLVGPVWGSAMY